MRVGTRLGLAFGALVMLLLAVAAIGLGQLAALNDEFNRIVVERHSTTGLLHGIVDELNVMTRSVQRTLLVSGADEVKKEVDRIDAAKQNVSTALERLDKALAREGVEGRALLQALHDRNSVLLVSLVRFTRLLSAGKAGEAKDLLNGQLGPQLDASLGAIERLIGLQTALMQKSVEEARASYADARNLIALLAAASVGLAILIGVSIARGIARPLGEAVGVAGRVASGNLASRIEVRGGDETGQLMAALKRMNESLRKIVNEVRTSSDAIAMASKELVSANGDLSQRTEEQASSLEQTASSMEQFASSVTQNADNAKQATALASGTSRVATEGEALVGRVVETMGSISASSRRIVDIIGVIDGIAFQTNILALNAAVEAARAGSQGQGFAVVAAEVRNLALRSAVAAKEIKGLINESVARVAEGTSLVDEAGATMKEILAGVRKVAQLMADIATASHEQREGIGQVNQTLAQMERMTQQNAALVEQAAAAMEMLESQARSLVQTVQVFKLEESQAGAPAPSRMQGQSLRRPVPPRELPAGQAPSPELPARL